MSTELIVCCVALLGVILWIGATMVGDALGSMRSVVRLGTAGWFHSGGRAGLDVPMSCLTRAWAPGTELRVYNSAGAYVDVQVIPSPEPFLPSREVLVHLSRDAYEQLSPLGINYLHVEVEPKNRAQERAAWLRAAKDGVAE